ncbi:UNKNOWN [Stylonychia lemnae]|uniref:Uncharacterized protein n=1 Tax=Stylonychia lemnae TaxID=5949 RepID=A0A077ZXL4_STYLE|nr:UNKNOWN [Stylonychia lemnae]|eukprot:CDW74645.1 UNKNOWN [Stylonychia lemnae]
MIQKQDETVKTFQFGSTTILQKLKQFEDKFDTENAREISMGFNQVSPSIANSGDIKIECLDQQHHFLPQIQTKKTNKKLKKYNKKRAQLIAKLSSLVIPNKDVPTTNHILNNMDATSARSPTKKIQAFDFEETGKNLLHAKTKKSPKTSQFKNQKKANLNLNFNAVINSEDSQELNEQQTGRLQYEDDSDYQTPQQKMQSPSNQLSIPIRSPIQLRNRSQTSLHMQLFKLGNQVQGRIRKRSNFQDNSPKNLINQEQNTISFFKLSPS